ncbi:CobW family GTP-binding protein [Bacterioplanoides sp.]|uniref:CobW family GTP-binding protein n=1 Tax=Bacterioplanoides sp. TaxID=2066072 RepID=UPI003B0000CA
MIRTHIITGFLGVGKTTAIVNLLKQKPEAEKWAVLVNEFGEIGVDGAILESQTGEFNNVVTKEIPGGCLCCVSGLPFQMGLNLLIAKEKPDVLLIEPTGLGHPRNILETLRNEHYQDILEIGASVCLVDPRHLSQPRYTQHETFVDQIQLADVLVANKSDLAEDADKARFDTLVRQSQPEKAAAVMVTQGQLDIALLHHPADPQRLAVHPEAHAHVHQKEAGLDAQQPLAADETLRRQSNHGQGHFSLGWLIQGQQLFSLEKIRNWLSGLEVERAKGLINTNAGAYVFNLREGVLTEMPTRALDESRLELISSAAFDEEALQQELLACRQDPV